MTDVQNAALRTYIEDMHSKHEHEKTFLEARIIELTAEVEALRRELAEK